MENHPLYPLFLEWANDGVTEINNMEKFFYDYEIILFPK